MKLAIVIPTYNEAETIPSLIKELFEKIKQLVEKLDVLIIELSIFGIISQNNLTLTIFLLLNIFFIIGILNVSKNLDNLIFGFSNLT